MFGKILNYPIQINIFIYVLNYFFIQIFLKYPITPERSGSREESLQMHLIKKKNNLLVCIFAIEIG